MICVFLSVRLHIPYPRFLFYLVFSFFSYVWQQVLLLPSYFALVIFLVTALFHLLKKDIFAIVRNEIFVRNSILIFYGANYLSFSFSYCKLYFRYITFLWWLYFLFYCKPDIKAYSPEINRWMKSLFLKDNPLWPCQILQSLDIYSVISSVGILNMHFEPF